MFFIKAKKLHTTFRIEKIGLNGLTCRISE
jgi:hypothetical protein